MSRRHTYARREAPNCPHAATQGHGYCRACRAELYASREPWPVEVWDWLNHTAATTYRPGLRAILKSVPKLPAYQGGRRETLAKLYARACATFAIPHKDSAAAAACQRAIGQGFGLGYGVVVTSGYGAVVQRGAQTQERTTQLLREDTPVIELPQEFHAALKRVRVCANKQSQAIRLSIGEYGVVLSAQDAEGNQASERIDLPGDRPEQTICMNADYLDAVCGVWPLRWYYRGALDAQSFEPQGADWRVVIMPMQE